MTIVILRALLASLFALRLSGSDVTGYPPSFKQADRKVDPLNHFSSISNDESILKTGTTIVGLCCSDGVVLGADTRTTGL